MEFRRSKTFIKAYASLNLQQQKQVEAAVSLFAEDRSNPALRDHPMKGKMKGYRSLSAAWDLRIIYRQEGDYMIIILINVETHNQVY